MNVPYQNTRGQNWISECFLYGQEKTVCTLWARQAFSFHLAFYRLSVSMYCLFQQQINRGSVCLSVHLLPKKVQEYQALPSFWTLVCPVLIKSIQFWSSMCFLLFLFFSEQQWSHLLYLVVASRNFRTLSMFTPSLVCLCIVTRQTDPWRACGTAKLVWVLSVGFRQANSLVNF